MVKPGARPQTAVGRAASHTAVIVFARFRSISEFRDAGERLAFRRVHPTNTVGVQLVPAREVKAGTVGWTLPGPGELDEPGARESVRAFERITDWMIGSANYWRRISGDSRASAF